MAVPEADPSPHQRLDGIQWLRAAAAGLVVIEHAKNAISTDHLGLPPDRSPLSVFPFSAGVDIFFVISGFIMAYASAELFGRPGAWRLFAVRRIARIVPLYWLLTAVMAVLFLAIGSRMWREAAWSWIAASFLFWPAPNPEGAPFPLFVIGWTLNYEIAFYAVFALFLGFSRPKALSGVAATLVAIVILGILAPPTALPLRFWSDPIILEFVFGIALFALFDRGALSLRAPARALLAVSALALLAMNPAYPGPWRPLVWGVPALMLVLAALPGTRVGADRPPSASAALAGDLSYAVYLAHFPIVLGAQNLLRRLPTEGWVWFGLFPLIVVIGTVAAAYLLNRVVERPILAAAREATALRSARPAR